MHPENYRLAIVPFVRLTQYTLHIVNRYLCSIVTFEDGIERARQTIEVEYTIPEL